MSNTMKKLVAMLVALTVACTFAPTLAFAANKVTVKGSDFATKTSAISKKAATAKKGTTNITMKKGSGYVQFKAPKAKKYTFTFSNVKTKGYSSNAFVKVQTPDASYPEFSLLTGVSTKGGKSDTLKLTANGEKSVGKGVSKTLKSRTATMQLKKGQQVFFFIYSGQSSGKTTAKLVIK